MEKERKKGDCLLFSIEAQAEFVKKEE